MRAQCCGDHISDALGEKNQTFVSLAHMVIQGGKAWEQLCNLGSQPGDICRNIIAKEISMPAGVESLIPTRQACCWRPPLLP